MVCTVVDSYARPSTQAQDSFPSRSAFNCKTFLGFLPASHVLRQPAARESHGLPEALDYAEQGVLAQPLKRQGYGLTGLCDRGRLQTSEPLSLCFLALLRLAFSGAPLLCTKFLVVTQTCTLRRPSEASHPFLCRLSLRLAARIGHVSNSSPYQSPAVT